MTTLKYICLSRQGIENEITLTLTDAYLLITVTVFEHTMTYFNTQLFLNTFLGLTITKHYLPGEQLYTCGQR